MRFMVIVKATKESESGAVPSRDMIEKMGKFNDALIKAGVLVSADGLQSSAKGARVVFTGDQRTVVDGPFAETKELIAGYWIWTVRSRQEAIDWVMRCPHPHPGTDTNIEIRQIFEAEDFA